MNIIIMIYTKFIYENNRIKFHLRNRSGVILRLGNVILSQQKRKEILNYCKRKVCYRSPWANFIPR